MKHRDNSFTAMRRPQLAALAMTVCAAASAFGQTEAGQGMSTPIALPTVYVVQGAGDTARVTLQITASGETVRVRSYQGELTVDPRRVEIVRASFPEGTTGVWNATPDGQMRFAAVSLDGAREGVLITLIVRSPLPLGLADFGVSMEEISVSGTPAREAVPASQSRVDLRPDGRDSLDGQIASITRDPHA